MKVKIVIVSILFAISAKTIYCQTLKNDVDSLSYAIGVGFGKNIEAWIQSGGFQNINPEIIAQVIEKTLQNTGQLLMTPEQANMYISAQHSRIQQLRYEKNLIAGREFLEKNKNLTGVVALPSGLQYKIITKGSGATPVATDRVTVHYHGTLIDGTVFDSSVERGQPATFGVTQVIQGWIEALQLMPVGSKWILYIPQDLAYGNRQQGNLIEPYSTLIFEVEMISIQ